jgi:hypothetical protein
MNHRRHREIESSRRSTMEGKIVSKDWETFGEEYLLKRSTDIQLLK